ncbi:MAG: response regulator [Myxococcales bacterium]|nr:MAG: response regulator [Myxococcales bacterium]
MTGQAASRDQPSALEQAWAAWQLRRNTRGMRGLLYIVAALYPLFGILDYLTAPPRWLWLLYGTRAVVTAITLGMFRVLKSPLFESRSNAVSAAYIVLISLGISLMTVFMGGLSSPYYAGLSLVIVATGLLFVWPMKVVIRTHATLVASFLLPNLILGRGADSLTSISNLFFLVSTAIIAGTGQVLAHASLREQVANQFILEGTRKNLEVANDELKKLDRFKSEFFANITHELKTPLTMVLTSLELLLDGELGLISEAQRSTFQSMQRSGAKLLRLIGDLLDLSRIEESRVRLRVAEHDLAAYLRELTSETQLLVQRKGVRLTFESEHASAPVFCDLERLERVFINLLSNATKFTDAGGEVVLRLSRSDRFTEVEVRDTGVGFPSELSERVFSRFFQTDMGKKRHYGGTGIGLSLAKDLVELHGGEIRAESETGKGARFTVRLQNDRDHFNPEVLDRRAARSGQGEGKRAADRGIADWRLGAEAKFRLLEIDEVTEQRVVERDADERHRSHTVLVVEDTPDVIRMIRLTLHHDFRVLAATNGAQGLELARKHHPSIIVTDLMMPVMDGLELTAQLRADPRLCHVPIVMLTARTEVESRVAGLQGGVDAYLGKPFSTKELMQTVRSLLRIQERTADLVLTQKMDSIEAIAGGLAHEIGNPLNYVKNALAVVQRDTEQLLAAARRSPMDSSLDAAAMERRTRKLFAVAESGVRRIAATVELMMRYSRNGYSRSEQPHDVYGAAREALEVLVPSVGKPLTVESRFEGEPWVSCVPEELNQVISNLIQNAAEAAPAEGGRLTLQGWNEGSDVYVSVADNGAGISAENVSKVFNAFFTTKEAGAGMGMGLTIAQRVARSLGGSIAVQSELGVGTRFTLRLPRLRPPSQRQAYDEARSAEPLVPPRS